MVFSRTKEEHDINFQKVVERINEYGLQENLDKRVFRKEEIEFLRYTIGYNKIMPQFKRSEAILNYPLPKSKKELQRFLGCINYDRMFIKDITKYAQPLYKLLNKEVKFIFTPSDVEIFKLLKSRWANKLELTMPDFSKLFVLEADASSIGIGAVLKQDDVLIVCISRALKLAERNYGITESEVLGCMWAMKK